MIEKEESRFYISDLIIQEDDSFLLTTTDETGVERIYLVLVKVNKAGELVGLKSIKKS